MTISVFQGKGGTAKTCLAVSLARMWHERKPLVLDMDPTRSAQDYKELLAVHGVDMEEVDTADFYGGGARKAPLRIIDCPPLFDMAKAALEKSDIILMPISGAGATWGPSKKAWADVADLGTSAKVMAVMTLYKPHAVTSRNILAEARELMGDQLLPLVIRYRSSIEEAAFKNLTIFDTEPNSPAAKQMRTLGAHIDALSAR